MGLTILVSRKEPLVSVVRWFLDPAGQWEFACGPLLRFAADEFRQRGYDLVRRHFLQYRTRRIAPGTIEPLYRQGDERRFRRFLGEQRPIRIGEDPPGILRLIPMAFQKNSLSWLRSLPDETKRTVRLDAPAESFWKAFDEALAATE